MLRATPLLLLSAAAHAEQEWTHPLLSRTKDGRIDISNIGDHIHNITQPEVGVVGGTEVRSAGTTRG